MNRSGTNNGNRQPALERLEAFVQQNAVCRSSEFVAAGVHQQYIGLALKLGLLTRVARGLYASAEWQGTNSRILAACNLIPGGVVCLESALHFHGLIEQEPNSVWIAKHRKAWKPRTDLPITVVRFSGEALTQGMVNARIAGVPIRVYSPMKTVTDCFKYRNKIGAGVGRAAIKAAIQKNQYNRQKLLRFAEICRVQKIVVAAADEADRVIKSQSQPKTERIWDFEVLRQEVWAEPLRVVARRYGVSDVALAKRCRKLGIPVPGRGYWSKMTSFHFSSGCVLCNQSLTSFCSCSAMFMASFNSCSAIFPAAS